MLMIITIITVTIASFAFLFPESMLKIIAELKRQLRLHVIRREGNLAAKELADQIHSWAKKRGIEKELVDEAIATNQTKVAHSVGKKYADKILGPPSEVERYY